MKENESVIVWPLRAEHLEDDLPLLWRVGVNARLAVGDGERSKESAVVQVGLNQAVDAGIPNHGP